MVKPDFDMCSLCIVKDVCFVRRIIMITPEFDVLLEWLSHSSKVSELLTQISKDLDQRGCVHDRSKLQAIEFEAFVKTRPKFKKANYGSKEYKECCEQIKLALEHHYKHNRHHPEFHEDGFEGMNLLDILEMLADWKAANERNPDLPFKESLTISFKKYNIPENMQKHIKATAEYLGWI